MRIILLWTLLTINPADGTVTITDYFEPHLTVESCLGAQVELLTIAKIRARCLWVEDEPERPAQQSVWARGLA